MPSTPVQHIVQRLRQSLHRGDDDSTDAELLTRFIEQHDAAACAALVRRHSGMVWGVCQRLLANHHDAEDAFQASFLVMVRRAATVRPRERLANWLYGVAFQTARKAKANAIKRHGRERQMSVLPEPATLPAKDWADLRPILDAALHALPEKYRLPLVLCDLEGMTRKDAAGRLGWLEGTLAGRLARARNLLAKKLARHGLLLSGGWLATLLAQNASAAPPTLLASTLNIAPHGATGALLASGVVSAKTLALTEGVLHMLFWTKVKMSLAAVLLVGCLGFWGAALSPRPVHSEQPTSNAPKVAAQVDPFGLVQSKPKAEPRPGTQIRNDFDKGDDALPTFTDPIGPSQSKPKVATQLPKDALDKVDSDFPLEEMIRLKMAELEVSRKRVNDALVLNQHEMTRLNGQLEELKARLALATRMQGKVLEIDPLDPRLANIALANGQKVARNQILYAIRVVAAQSTTNPSVVKNTKSYLGTLRVIAVEPSKAVVQFTPSQPGVGIKAGDDWTTDSPAPSPSSPLLPRQPPMTTGSSPSPLPARVANPAIGTNALPREFVLHLQFLET